MGHFDELLHESAVRYNLTLSVPCPRCKAEVGALCTDLRGAQAKTLHKARAKAADKAKAAGGLRVWGEDCDDLAEAKAIRLSRSQKEILLRLCDQLVEAKGEWAIVSVTKTEKRVYAKGLTKAEAEAKLRKLGGRFYKIVPMKDVVEGANAADVTGPQGKAKDGVGQADDEELDDTTPSGGKDTTEESSMGRFDALAGLTEASSTIDPMKRLKMIGNYALAASAAVRDLENEISLPHSSYVKKLGKKARSAIASIMAISEDEEHEAAALTEAGDNLAVANINELVRGNKQRVAKAKQAAAKGDYAHAAKAIDGVKNHAATLAAWLAKQGGGGYSMAKGRSLHKALGMEDAGRFDKLIGLTEDEDYDDEQLAEAKKKGSLRELKHKVWMMSADDQVGLVAAFRAKGDAHAWQMSKANSPFVKGGGSFVVEGEEDEAALTEDDGGRFDGLAGLTEGANATDVTKPEGKAADEVGQADADDEQEERAEDVVHETQLDEVSAELGL